QLETSLHGLGFAPNLTIDTHFSTATYWAVRRWQSASHLPVTGSVPLGQAVFAPTAVRIEANDLKVGEQVQPGAVVEHGSGRAAAVTTQLDPAELPSLKVGEHVRVTLPDGKVKRGRIATVGAVAQDASPAGGGGGGGGGGGNPDEVATVPVTITIGGRISGFLDQAQVQVAITRESHKGVLAVPITALRGVVGGGYEVIVANATKTRHVRVDVGLFDETAGLAEVQGPGLTAGQRVEVPREGA
ncbi:MAG: hypothetical protein QOJ72_330, partial [Nocardioidaceae bacterium]|nr:hypothetical protein [Nocardioidaceae bacterium]